MGRIGLVECLGQSGINSRAALAGNAPQVRGVGPHKGSTPIRLVDLRDDETLTSQTGDGLGHVALRQPGARGDLGHGAARMSEDVLEDQARTQGWGRFVTGAAQDLFTDPDEPAAELYQLQCIHPLTIHLLPLYRQRSIYQRYMLGRTRLAAIEVRHLTKRFGSVTAVEDLTFGIEPGEVTAFLGPNGAGKTTTLRLLLGLMTPTSGTATINGRSYADLADPLRQVGAVLESASFHPGRTARAHLRLQALAANAAQRRVDTLLDLVGLGDNADRRVGGFSLGMRQRLGLATALIGDPKTLILDEPASALDPAGVRWLRDLLRDMAGEGRTVIVSSHLLAEVAQSVDRVVIIDRGKLVADAPMQELVADRSEFVRVRTPQPDQLRHALQAEGVEVRVVDVDTIEVTGSTAEEVGVAAAKLGLPIFESRVQAASLEDVFIGLTSHQDTEVRTP